MLLRIYRNVLYHNTAWKRQTTHPETHNYIELCPQNNTLQKYPKLNVCLCVTMDTAKTRLLVS